MKTAIHPEYVIAKVHCSCGNEFMTRSTKAEIRNVTGLDLVLRGDVAVSLFPTGSVSFANVTLGDDAKPVLAADRVLTFNAAYVELWRKHYVECVGAGPAEIQPAYAWGSHPSKLVQVLRKGHHDVKLTAEELGRIITWVDLNAPYYPTYNCAYPESVSGRCPLTRAQLARLCELVGPPFNWSGEGSPFNSFGSSPGIMVSFDRPELSPCLGKFADQNDPNYAEALAIIRAGRESMASQPEADRPGFVPCAEDRRREEKYAQRRQVEQQVRSAIRDGTRVYDRPADTVGDSR